MEKPSAAGDCGPSPTRWERENLRPLRSLWCGFISNSMGDYTMRRRCRWSKNSVRVTCCIRQAVSKAIGVTRLDALPIANRRYGRLQICATHAGREAIVLSWILRGRVGMKYQAGV